MSYGVDVRMNVATAVNPLAYDLSVMDAVYVPGPGAIPSTCRMHGVVNWAAEPVHPSEK